jgi:hypothetical protein
MIQKITVFPVVSSNDWSGQWKKIIPQDCAGFWYVYKAHPPVHIWICFGGCNAVDGPKGKIDVELFFSTGLRQNIPF